MTGAFPVGVTEDAPIDGRRWRDGTVATPGRSTAGYFLPEDVVMDGITGRSRRIWVGENRR
ncbi:hypothetical protein KCP78_01900 [Salmonella enterica subsp. enterica]|nr:hypothetical protein KCP78_01900 [Salmonella enterica subsp. enterica]